MVVKQLSLSKNQLSILSISTTSHLRKCTKLHLHQNNIEYIPASVLESKILFRMWDFASQEEYIILRTHQVFLSKRSLYFAVWNIEEGREGITKLKPWLNNIIL